MGKGVVVPKSSGAAPGWQSAVLERMEMVVKKCVGGYQPVGSAFVNGCPTLILT